MSVVLEASGVLRRIGARVIVNGIELALEQGESLSLIGPSGCGKTTLLQILGLLDRPDGGVVKIGGSDAWAGRDEDRARLRLERIGFVFQQHNLFETMTALENVSLPAWRLGKSRARAAKRAEELLERFNLAHAKKTRASELSGGEAQRVAIARAIVNEPALILADEPTGNLDSAASHVVMETLFETSKSGAALLIVTHDLDIAARATRRVAMLDGQIVRPSQAPPPSRGAPITH